MADDLLPWGLRPEQLEDVASLAARMSYSRLLSFDQRYDEALSSIGLAIAVSLLPPTRRELVDAGILGINQATEAERQAHGVGHSTRPGHRMAVYWGASNRLQGSAADAIDERLAVGQVWRALSDRDQETLATLAEYGDDTAAARSLDLPAGTYRDRLMRARRRARAIWFDWESPGAHYSKAGGRAGPSWTLARAIRARVTRRRNRRAA